LSALEQIRQSRPDAGFVLSHFRWESLETLFRSSPHARQRELLLVGGWGGVKAHRLFYHSTLGLRVIKQKKNDEADLMRERVRVAEEKLPESRVAVMFSRPQRQSYQSQDLQLATRVRVAVMLWKLPVALVALERGFAEVWSNLTNPASFSDGSRPTCGPISPNSRRDCVKSLRSSYTGLYPQIRCRARKEQLTSF